MPEVLRDAERPAQSNVGAAWFIKRTIMAVLIFCVSIGGIAWLLHASIDPTIEANAAETEGLGKTIQVTGSTQLH